jgi:drug/metabolite transporter (DMT)-like permease
VIEQPQHLNTGVLAFYRFSLAAVVLSLYLLVTNSFGISNVYQVIVGILVGIGTILYYESITRIKAAQTSALELSTPVFATILAFYLLSEIPTIMQIIGVGCLFLGLYFISKKEE